MSDMADDVVRLYQDVILRHSRAPSHAHRPARFDASGTGDNPMCGDRVEVFVRRGPAGAIADIGFEARGCAISIASADLMAEVLQGAAAADAARIAAAFERMIRTGDDTDADLARLRPLAGVHSYPARRRCATLPWQALTAALPCLLRERTHECRHDRA